MPSLNWIGKDKVLNHTGNQKKFDILEQLLEVYVRII